MRSKKVIALVIVLILLAILIITRSVQKRKEKENALAEAGLQQSEETDYYFDEYGNKYIKGDTEMTYEDVIYAYIKSLSLLDFNSALNYVGSKSTVVSEYEALNFNSNNNSTTALKSKIYKKMVSSLLVEDIVDTVILPNKYVVTLNISHLDFNNKEFWTGFENDIFKELKMYREDRSISDVNGRAYNYVLEYVNTLYDHEEAPTITSEIELTIERNKFGSWLISNDSDLLTLCSNNNGTYLTLVITDKFNSWYIEVTKED